MFAVDAPRAGRLEVRVTGVVDSRAYPWNKSGLPVDPIVELYTSSGTLIKRVDDAMGVRDRAGGGLGRRADADPRPRR